MAFPGHFDERHLTPAAGSPLLGREPADQLGEQWHGTHSNAQDPREPRRQPGGVQRSVNNDVGAEQHRS